ncbi:unnamed protein product, partial [Rangifer tarandus platyrhynchus]
VDPAFPPGCSSSSSLRPAVIWGSRRRWGLCPADLSSPCCGPHWPGPGLWEAVTLSPPLPRPGSTVHLGCHLQDLLPHPLPHGRPEEPEGQLGWMSGSLSRPAATPPARPPPPPPPPWPMTAEGP